MHRINTSIRRIAAADLPTITPIGEPTRPMNAQELLNTGIQHLSGDFYSCISQDERDDETLEWRPKDGQALPGAVVTQGVLQERYAKLPADVKGKILRASVIRSSLGNADDLASAVLIQAAEAAEAAVGPVRDGEPLIDVADARLVLSEAQRQLGIEGSGFSRTAVQMDAVAVGDVIEAEDIIPHSWAGEPKR